MALHYTTGTELVPGFRLVKLLGRGGFGEVWKASAPGGTDAAIKIISLGERTGFKELRAIRLVKAVRHPNLAPIIAYWLLTEEGKVLEEGAGDNTIVRRAQDLYLVIAMGLGDKSLHDRLKECQREGKQGIPPAELINHVEDAARAVDYLNQPVHDLGDHTGGIQHCDLKPQNMLLVGGAAQVCDFGLARVLGDSRVTSAKGSAAYMAPELIADNKPSKNTDQYFLAISYVELRTGSLPVDVTSPAKAIWAHVQGQLDLSKLPPEEQTVIKRATSVKPEDRYDSCMEMARALRQAIEGAAPQNQRPSRIIKLDQLMTPGSEVVPGYKLVRLLGKGGYGHVWEASAPGGKKVALKIIRNLEGVQGKQEFKALELIKGVDHNHLMELHAFWLLDRNGNVIPDEERDRPDAPTPSILVIASKLANMNLLQRLNECRGDGIEGIPLPELMNYMRQAAEAIDYLNTPQHQLGDRKVSIQHRDIKPENILLASGVVKVGDFGLAKVVEGTSAVIHGDSAGLTLAYAAPEMFTSVVTAWSDQYCLALTYFKLRTSGWPFPSDAKPNDIIKSHVLGKLDLSRLPEVEQPVIARATAVKPENRYPACMAMIEDLERVLRGAEELPPPPFSRRSLPKSQRSEGISGLAASSGQSLSSSSPKAIVEPVPGAAPRFGTLAPEEPSRLQDTVSFPVEAGPADTTPPSITPVGSRSMPMPEVPQSSLEAQTTKTFTPVQKSTGAPESQAPEKPDASTPAATPERRASDRGDAPPSRPSARDRHMPDESPPATQERRKPENNEQIQSRPAPARPATMDLDQSLRAPSRDDAHGRGPETPQPASSHPPTNEPIRLPTQEVDVREAPRPAGWRTSRHDPTPAPRSGSRALGSGSKALGKVIGAILILGILAAAGYFGRNYISFGGRDDNASEEARQLIREHRFTEALNRLEARGVPDELRRELRGSARAAWLDQTRRIYGDDRDYRRAGAEATELALRFPEDPDVQKLNDQVRPAAEVSEGIDKGGDYATLYRKLADARALDDATRKDLNGKLVEAWSRGVRNELQTRQNYDEAEKMADALQRAVDTPETAKLYRQASLARKIADLALVKREYVAAAREVNGEQGRMLDESLRKSLGSKVAQAWVDAARKAFNDRDEDLTARMVRDILDTYPGQTDALALRGTLRQKMLGDAVKSLASAELQAKLPEGKDRADARLREAEGAATKILDLVNGREPGKEDPDAFYVLGRVAELRNDHVTAYVMYLAALPEPERADFAKLGILLARIEFITDPRRKDYIKTVGAYRPTAFIRYADRAVALVNDNPTTDATLKARAYACSAVARVLVNDAAAPGSEGVKERRDEAISRFETALKLYPRDPRPWRWRYDLARQLRAKMVESSAKERLKLQKEAIDQLERAKEDAPAADAEKLVAPLQKQIKDMK
jgi:serine/threonine protein kinase